MYIEIKKRFSHLFVSVVHGNWDYSTRLPLTLTMEEIIDTIYSHSGRARMFGQTVEYCAYDLQSYGPVRTELFTSTKRTWVNLNQALQTSEYQRITFAEVDVR